MPLPLIIPILSSLVGTNLYTKIVKGNGIAVSSAPTSTGNVYAPIAKPQATNATTSTTATAIATPQATAPAQATAIYPAPLEQDYTGYEALAYYNAVLNFYYSLGSPSALGSRQQDLIAQNWWAQYQTAYPYAYNDYWNAVAQVELWSTPNIILTTTQTENEQTRMKQKAISANSEKDAQNLAFAKNVIFSIGKII